MNGRIAVTLIFLVAAVVAFGKFGVWENLQAYCGGYSVCVDDADVNLGEMAAEESRVVTVRLRNVGFGSAELVGIESTCSCVSTGSLPVDFSGKKTLDREFRINAPPEEGEFSISVVLLFNTGVLERIPVRFHGDVSASLISSQEGTAPIPDPTFLSISL